MTNLSTCQQPNKVGTRLIDMGTNTSDVEVRSQRDGVRIIDSSIDKETLMANMMNKYLCPAATYLYHDMMKH